jgi:rhodanese-related sulfurtransferase
MASKRHRSTTTGKRGSQPVASSRIRLYLAIAGSLIAVLVFIAIGFVALNGSGSSPASGLAAGETIHQGTGGQWTNVTPDRLAQMLQTKDFTFVNVKTPYIGEIDRTDLYIPYDQLTARASQLPQAKDAKILVYCRSGAESAIASQTLLTLGYTNVWNLDGGMNAWQSSGRTLVQKNR